jgi:arginase
MADAMITLIGLPYDASSSFMRGPAKAPQAIRDALHSSSTNSYSESGVDVLHAEILRDAGDLDLGDESRARAHIESVVRRIVEAGERPLSLGGDHSVTYPIIRGLADTYRGLTVLQLDAHPDLYPEFEGDRYSHACPFARILEDQLIGRLVQVGIRTMNAVQLETAGRYGVQTIDMSSYGDVRVPTFEQPLYVSVDLDVLDPAFAPGVSHREPGGLSVREVIRIIQSLPPLVGADVVELNPDQDSSDISARAAAKIVKELAAKMVR